MARSQNTALGGGIAAGIPFTLGALTRVSSVDPAQIAASIVVQRTAGATQVITIGADQYPAATEILKVIGGLISDMPGGDSSFIAGQKAKMTTGVNFRNTCIGFQSNCNGDSGVGNPLNCSDNVVIGSNTNQAVGGLRYGVGTCVLIGNDQVVSGTAPVAGAGIVLIGYNASINTPTGGLAVGLNAHAFGQCVAIGFNASVTNAKDQSVAVGAVAVCVGSNCVAIGDNARAAFDHSIALGRSATTLQANQFVVGSLAGGAVISSVLVGAGDTTNGGQAVTYRHTNASGSNDPGANIKFQACLPTGNAATAGQIQFATGLVHGSDAILQTSTVQVSILPSTGLTGQPNVRFDNVTSTGGALAGTLTNAPAVGNPTFWLPVNVVGTRYGIPCWALP